MRMTARSAADKLEACEGQLSQGGRIGRFVSSGAKKDGGEQQLHKICCDANKLALEHIKGVSGQVLASPAPRAVTLEHTILLSPEHSVVQHLNSSSWMVSRVGVVRSYFLCLQ